MIYLGDKPIGMNFDNMRLVHKHTISTDYTGTFESVYNNEVAPYITFGDYHKLCVVVFENNTTTLSNAINVVFFQLGIAPGNMTSNTRNGGMIRGGYANIRNFMLSNDGRCNSGTIVKIYEMPV